MLLSSSWRINQLIQSRNECQHRLQMLMIELNDLKTYGSNVSDGAMSIGELLRTPTSMYRRNMAYMTAADAYSENVANIQMQELTASPMYINMMAQQSAEAQAQYAAMMRQQFKKQAAQQFSKYETAMINEKEKAMELEKQSLQEELEQIKAELQSQKQENKESIQEFFGGGGR